MGRPKGSKNKPKVKPGARDNEPVTLDGEVIGRVADLPPELKPKESILDKPPGKVMPQRERAIREDAAGQAVLATVERTEHGKRLAADMKAKMDKLNAELHGAYDQFKLATGNILEAQFLRPGYKVLAVNGTPLPPEWQEVVSVSIVIEMGDEIVRVQGHGDVIHKLHMDAKCTIDRS